MNRREYFNECTRLSNYFGEKLDAVDAFVAKDPELSEDGAYEQYWDLQNEASAAALTWSKFCSENRPDSLS